VLCFRTMCLEPIEIAKGTPLNRSASRSVERIEDRSAVSSSAQHKSGSPVAPTFPLDAGRESCS
jgi:hypothetical protein